MILLLQMLLILCNGGQIPEVISRIVRGESHVRRALELSKFGDMERGYCARANGEHQKSHVTKAGGTLEDVYTSHPYECLAWCMSQEGLTGCEFVWSQPDQGCFAHRGELSHVRGDFYAANICWISTNPPANADAVIAANEGCSPDDILVEYIGSDANIQELVGRYKKRTDCERTEGGAWFGGADFSVCFEGPNSFMIWNTGCGWQIGLPAFDYHGGTNWDRRASTYAGQCSEIPPEGLTTEALTTQTYTDDWGKVIPGLTSHEQKSC